MRTMLILAFVTAAAASASAATGATGSASYGGKAATMPASFTARLAAVCQSQTLVLTVAAKTACTSGAFPRVTATAFFNNGTGAEFNTLMRQLPAAPTVASK